MIPLLSVEFNRLYPGMIGSGKAHVRTVVGIAQAQCKDGEPPLAVQAFASLGSFGRNNTKEERDLHVWLRNLHGINLEVYYFPLRLNVA